ncbi:DUF1905 domain-containing protein [Streptomyces sp. NP160]|uniref:DUF1905 domain-containing protein n=1 Tax=Streptomyces sp. NP160 TaxID=2586637 RepID=UPI001118620A|nr:DUF1905 domain-containing protein [Streptomyces sp. NP160]TNM61114.1 DUF1905 domain-containing protein [Streptomyces sp. NP160]
MARRRPGGHHEQDDDGGPPGAQTRYEFTAELWRWQARTDEWVFATLPQDASDEIAAVPRPRAGFGAVRVTVTVGGSRWTTSIFPEPSGAPDVEGERRVRYVLPLKKAVRAREGLELGDEARVAVETHH